MWWLLCSILLGFHCFLRLQNRLSQNLRNQLIVSARLFTFRNYVYVLRRFVSYVLQVYFSSVFHFGLFTWLCFIGTVATNIMMTWCKGLATCTCISSHWKSRVLFHCNTPSNFTPWWRDFGWLLGWSTFMFCDRILWQFVQFWIVWN